MEIKNVYIVVNFEKHEYIGRQYIGQFYAHDFISPISYTYDGRRSCSAALTFETRERAENYINAENLSDRWQIALYTPCYNSIIK